MKKSLFIAIPFILVVILLSFTPIISRDALTHHMALPKLWLKNGVFSVDAFKLFSFYPANIDILYYFGLKLNLEFLPKFIHSSFLILTAILVYRYIKEKHIKLSLQVLAFILTITIPINQRLSSEVYVDLGLLFFSSLSLIYFLKWKDSEFKSKKYFYISAIGSGLAFGAKYNGLVSLIIINFFVMFAYSYFMLRQ